MRLIDADKLLEEINGAENRRADMLMYEWYSNMVSRQPTAYDVDRVVEQLEKRKKHLLKDYVLADKADEVRERTMARINEIDGLIDIVKSGCIE